MMTGDLSEYGFGPSPRSELDAVSSELFALRVELRRAKERLETMDGRLADLHRRSRSD